MEGSGGAGGKPEAWRKAASNAAAVAADMFELAAGDDDVMAISGVGEWGATSGANPTVPWCLGRE